MLSRHPPEEDEEQDDNPGRQRPGSQDYGPLVFASLEFSEVVVETADDFLASPAIRDKDQRFGWSKLRFFPVDSIVGGEGPCPLLSVIGS